jgi:competence protein ComEA
MQFSPSRFVKALALTALMVAVGGTVAHAAEGGASPVDINQASVAELASLPGIGESKAKAIVEHRSAEPFQSVEDLKKVKGIGERTFESLRPSITVGGGGQPK